MNAFRKTSLVVLVALLAIVAVGVFQSSAIAGGHNHNHHNNNHHKHHNFHHSFHHGHHGHFHYPKYVNYHWQYAKPVLVPVTHYDCYGQPYIVWQTNYSHLGY
jgi:hypothetical protein